MRGKCHICLEVGEVTYCPLCQHWFDQKCRRAWFHRGLAAIKELTGGKRAGCCGPQEVSRASEQV